MSKREGKSNLTTILLELKESYVKVFKEKFPSDNKDMEKNIIEIARKVKSGKKAFWYKDESGIKKVFFEEKKVYFS
jgi:hypothetical protein